MLAAEGFNIPETAESNYDDPSLALMFSRLKSMSLQTIKGSNMIPGQQEFDFVLQIARVFCRMGERSRNLGCSRLTLNRMPCPCIGSRYVMDLWSSWVTSGMGLFIQTWLFAVDIVNPVVTHSAAFSLSF
jgi:hypothetical protein